jgi:hypothetical protein
MRLSSYLFCFSLSLNVFAETKLPKYLDIELIDTLDKYDFESKLHQRYKSEYPGLFQKPQGPPPKRPKKLDVSIVIEKEVPTLGGWARKQRMKSSQEKRRALETAVPDRTKVTEDETSERTITEQEEFIPPQHHYSGLRGTLHSYRMPRLSKNKYSLGVRTVIIDQSYSGADSSTMIKSDGMAYRMELEGAYQLTEQVFAGAVFDIGSSDSQFQMSNNSNPMFTGESLGFQARNIEFKIGYAYRKKGLTVLFDLGSSLSIEKSPLNSSGVDFFSGLTAIYPLSERLQGYANLNYVMNDQMDVFSNGFSAIGPRDTLGGEVGFTLSMMNSFVESVGASAFYGQNPLKGMTAIEALDVDHLGLSFGAASSLNNRINFYPQINIGLTESTPGFSGSVGIEIRQ